MTGAIDPRPSALPPWVEQVQPEWIDYNGHLSEAYYVLVFGHATDAVMAEIGMTLEAVRRTGRSLFTREAHVRYLGEVGEGARLEVQSSVIGVRGKLVWLWHELLVEDRLRATEEVLAVHVDTATGRSCPLPEDVRRRAASLLVPVPTGASGQIVALHEPR